MRTKKTAAFFNTIMASPLMFVVISGETMMMPQRSTKSTKEKAFYLVLVISLHDQ
jgi:hypothetical protein